MIVNASGAIVIALVLVSKALIAVFSLAIVRSIRLRVRLIDVF